MGSTMVQLCREMVSFYRLSIQNKLVSDTVWPQFVMQVLTGGCQPLVWELELRGRGGRMGSVMGPPSSPGMTSYKFPIVTIGLTLTVFAVLRMFQTDRRTELV